VNRNGWFVLTVSLLSLASPALASPPSEVTRACVASSTQGQTDRDEGRLLAARQQLLSCVRDECPAIVKKSCGEWLTELDLRIPSVVVRVFETGQSDITDARVSIDGEPVALDGRALMLDPGPHKITVEATGWLPVQRSFLVAERERARLLSVQLPKRDEPADARDSAAAVAPSASTQVVLSRGDDTERVTTQRPTPPRGFRVPAGAYVLLGIGVGGIVSFAVLNDHATSELDRLRGTCSPNCTQAERDNAERSALAADILLGVGIASVVGAGAWTLGAWLRRKKPRAAPEARAGLSLAPHRTGLGLVWRASY
jgi:hypothetical protein